MADTNKCAPSPTRLPSPPKSAPTPSVMPPPADMSLGHKVTYREDASSFIPPSKSSSSPSFSPSFSTGSSESYTLSRCSSISSLASSYSAITTTSVLSTDDESDDQICLISILKKPKGSPYSHSRQRNHGRNSSETGDESRLVHNTDDDEDDNETDDANNELHEWEDDESECDIIFERNVTFDEPLATDIITGAQVLPSSRSRLEWTAVRARECLERERAVLEGAWSGSQEDAIETGVDAVSKNMSSEVAGPRWQDGRELEAEEFEEEEREEEEEHISKLLPKPGLLDGDRHTTSKGMNCGEEGEVKRRYDAEAEAEDLVHEITETVIRLVGQQQQ